MPASDALRRSRHRYEAAWAMAFLAVLRARGIRLSVSGGAPWVIDGLIGEEGEQPSTPTTPDP